SADLVTMATEDYCSELLRRMPELGKTKVRCLTNGFDPDDFRSGAVEPPMDRFVVTYAGTVARLTSLAGFLDAIRLLASEHPMLCRHLEVRVYGRVVPSEMRSFAGTENLGVRRFGYVNHDRTLLALSEGHLNLCVLDDVPGAERIYPAKVFE